MMSDVEKLSDDDMQIELDTIYNICEITNEVFSLTDLIELVREQTKREYNV